MTPAALYAQEVRRPAVTERLEPGSRAALAKLGRRLATGLFIVALPVLIVTSVVRVLVSDSGFTTRGLREYDSAARTGLPLSELDRAAREITHYFENDASTLRVTVFVSGREQPLFSDKEVQHMRDVKSLVRVLFVVQEVSLVYVMTYLVGVFLWARERGLRTLARQVLAAVALGFLTVGAIGVLALTGFDAAWTRFHEIAFRNDLWRLNPATDRLIQMFPEPFWEEATLLAGAASLATAVVVAALAGGYLAFSRSSR